MKPYDLVIADSLQQLIETTNEAIAHGYMPIGSVTTIEGRLIQPILLITSKSKTNGSTSKKSADKKIKRTPAHHERVHRNNEGSYDF